MFAGHLGVALAASRIEPRVNVGVFAAASLLLDIALWLFILAGWESATIPADFADTHQPVFVFPYSHGLAAAVAWSAAAAALAFVLCARRKALRSRAALVVALVAFSHWLVDASVHRPELPLAGADSAAVGLGLWDRMPLALAAEAALVAVGVALFLAARRLSRPRQLAIGALGLLVLVFTIAGMTVAPPPPSATAMAASSLATIVLVCLLIGWLDRGTHPAAAPH